ncbi:MAG TPA: MnhB domain-containing protein [Acidobacteriaceae bacterium]|jgi:multicomponent Na+:H+ antiporter subunit B|nr:MnhB domain-containing protein [Acidobacteriaceae bacterium]
MSEKRRLLLFLVGAVGVAAVYCAGIRNMPPWGTYRGPYGDVIASLAVFQRHATDTVNAITYDYRGFDTLGEEFILFSAVTGVMLLLRPETKEKRRRATEGENPASFRDSAALSETVQVFTTGVFGFSVLFGIYIGTHGQLTPGGGFQGGVIIAAAPMLLYVAENFEAFHRILSHPLMELMEALGAAAYAVVGLIALAFGAPFLTNVLPLGKTGDVFSSGTIALISALVGVEVAAGFMLVTFEYLREILSRQKNEED